MTKIIIKNIVLVSTCAFTTIVYVMIFIMETMLHNIAFLTQFTMFVESCHLLVNYISIIFQFGYYDKLYFKIFSKYDERLKEKYNKYQNQILSKSSSTRETHDVIPVDHE